jgi:hypothetical protein
VQLKAPASIRTALATLSATLLGTSLAGAAGVNQSESSFLVYSEKDRVKTTEGIFRLSRQLSHNYHLNLRFTYDGLTGATPTGGAPSRKPQTLTRASGGSGFVVAPGELPTDHFFKDTRFGAEASLSHPLGNRSTLTVGGHASTEHDYTSVEFNFGLTRDFNRKNTTVGLAASYSHDVSSPIGGIPVPFADVGSQAGSAEPHVGSSRPKNVYAGLASLTQILDSRTVARAGLSITRFAGYLTDPYKMISLVVPSDSVNAGEPVTNLYENRPESRDQYSLFGELRRYLLGLAANGSYRYFWDTWGTKSHTIDLTLARDFGPTGSLEPHVRWYRQTRANFYHPFLIQGTPVPEYASADNRIAEFHALTYGLGYGVPVGNNTRLHTSMEWYTQRGDKSPPEAFGVLETFNLFPDLNAVMFTITLQHSF